MGMPCQKRRIGTKRTESDAGVCYNPPMWKWELQLWLAEILRQLGCPKWLVRRSLGLSPLQIHILTEREKMTRSLWISIMKKGHWTCKYCGVSKYGEMEVDHIYPISKGGITTESNLQVLCRRCNKRKGAKIL